MTKSRTTITSLSDVLPPGAAYFYGFPSGQDSGFYNECPPEIEELVAMRPAVCAGERVDVVTFASTVSDDVWRVLEGCGVPVLPRDRIIALPTEIDQTWCGDRRNRAVKTALIERLRDRTLVMAQPYLDEQLRGKYLLGPEIVAWFNDKRNISELVPARFRVLEYARFADGGRFQDVAPGDFPIPCVVKISSSGAGDGVRICRSAPEFLKTQREFAASTGTILVQQFIERAGEIDLKFAVPHDKGAPFQLIGASSEVTGPNGEYLGSVVHPEEGAPSLVTDVFDALQAFVLPRLRAGGWFGVGGVDVLIARDGSFYFSDFNCRMTASMAQTLQINTGALGRRSALTFNGRFLGSLAQLRARIAPLARFGSNDQVVNLIALASSDAAAEVRLHGGVLFDQPEVLREHIDALTRLGLRSSLFTADGVPAAVGQGWR